MSDLISREAAIYAIHEDADWLAAQGSDWQVERMERDKSILKSLPSAEREIAENLYLCKCYITDKDGLQHEVIHVGDIRRVTGWEI